MQPTSPPPALRSTSLSTGTSAGLALAVLCIALSPGCRAKDGATLAGTWEGPAICGGDDVGVTMRIILSEDNPQSYSGSGEVLGLSADGTDAQAGMNLEVEQPEPEGAQTVEVTAACALYVGEASEAVDCSGFTELGWDGADLLGASFANFFGSGLDCEVELGR